MKKKTIVSLCWIVALVFLFGCSTQKSVETVTKIPVNTIVDTALPEKEQALQFSLSVVESYFTLDCDFYLSVWHSPWVYLEYYQIVDINFNELSEADKSFACEEMKKNVKTNEHWQGAPPRGTYSFQDFLTKYESKLHSFSEYKTLFPRLDKWQDTESYLFTSKPKEGETKFVWDDTLFFMVKKIGNEWKIVATY